MNGRISNLNGRMEDEKFGKMKRVREDKDDEKG